VVPVRRTRTFEKIAALDAQCLRPAGHGLGPVLDRRRLIDVAARQNAAEDAPAAAGPVLVCDTDAFATTIWYERYRGRSSRRTPAGAISCTS
jgi:hypothetical protein